MSIEASGVVVAAPSCAPDPGAAQPAAAQLAAMTATLMQTKLFERNRAISVKREMKGSGL